MGCDIHTHVELKIDGKWEHYLQPRIPRNYDLFAKMANVRNGDNKIKPISDGRGLPEDVSKTTMTCFKHDGNDAHSESWLSSKEFTEEIMPILKYGFEHEYFGYLFGNGWDIKCREWLPKNVEDYRLVFWFDN